MNSLLEKIRADLNSAVLSRDEVARSTLRLLLASLHNAKIAKGADLTDEEVTREVAKDVKRHKESITAYEAGNRADLVDKERGELEVLSRYLPKQLSEEEMKKAVDEAIAAAKPTGIADMGKVMSAVMAKVGEGADGGTIAQEVKKRLGSE